MSAFTDLKPGPVGNMGGSLSTKKNDEDGGYTDGIVYTRHGIVKVYSQGGGTRKSFHCTTLFMVRNGLIYNRQYKKRFTERGLVTKAKEFAQDVFWRKEAP